MVTPIPTANNTNFIESKDIKRDEINSEAHRKMRVPILVFLVADL